jgi:hypothetical protein
MDYFAIGFAILAVLVCASAVVTEHRQQADLEEASLSHVVEPAQVEHVPSFPLSARPSALRSEFRRRADVDIHGGDVDSDLKPSRDHPYPRLAGDADE